MTDVTGCGVRDVVRLRPGPPLAARAGRASALCPHLRGVGAVDGSPGRATPGSPVMLLAGLAKLISAVVATRFGVTPTNQRRRSCPLSLPCASVALSVPVLPAIAAPGSVAYSCRTTRR